jgi:hypothetical protein
MRRLQITPFVLAFMVLASWAGADSVRADAMLHVTATSQQRQVAEPYLRPATEKHQLQFSRDNVSAPRQQAVRPTKSRRPVTQFPKVSPAAGQSPLIRRFNPGSARVLRPALRGYRLPRKPAGLTLR